MEAISRALHTRIDVSNAQAVVTPLYQASAFHSTSPYFYTRKDNPNVQELEQVTAALENTRFAVATSTGMAAITLILESLAPSSTLVVNRDIYGCSYKLFQRIAARRGWNVVPLDLSTDRGVEAIPADVSMVFFESPTNPYLKTIPIKRIAEHVHRLNPSAKVVVDNTWATPLFQHPLEFGADLSLHSATKYLSGHSDVMGGFVMTNSATEYEELRATRFYTGPIMDPHSAWLLRRSMQTLGLRMEHHQRVTREMVDFLNTLPQVVRVYYPLVDGVQLTGYGGIVFFELRRDLVDRYVELASRLKLFDTGTGMACVTSMIAQPYTGSHASMTDQEKAEIGLDRSLIRLCFGLEAIDDLKADLSGALRAIDEAASASQRTLAAMGT